MTGQRQQRRLAAIVAADVVGYSGLMEADETGTIERLKTLRAGLVDPAISRHHGRIVKLMGDGMLVEFASVVDAVQCAVEIQRAIPDHEIGIPEEQRIRYRIGINVGDIIIDGDDIFGDGVNIAARLEALAMPGGVAISGTTYDQVRSKIDFGYEDAGAVTVKNIRQPVRIYHVMPDGGASEAIAAASQSAGGRRRRVILAAALMLLVALAGGGWWWVQGRGDRTETHSGMVTSLLDKPAVAVLPFVNTSGDATQDAFADGLTRNVIGGLSNIYGLAVVSTAVSMTYKGKSVPVKQLAAELQVQSVLEGSVQPSGEQLRINAELVDAATGQVIWSEPYTRDADDLLAVQDEIVKNVMTALQVELVAGEMLRNFSSTTDNPEAFEYASRVFRHYMAQTDADNAEGIRLLSKALELDPEYSRAWVSLGWFHFQRVYEGWSEDRDADVAAAQAVIDRAIELSPRLPASYTLAGNIALILEQDHDRAIELSRKGVDLNLNNAQGWWVLGRALAYAGVPEEGLRAFEQVLRLTPRLPPLILGFMGEAYLLAGRLDEAETALRETAISADGGKGPAQAYLGLALINAERGREEEARAAVASAIRADPRVSLGFQRTQWIFRDEKLLESWLDLLRGLGLPE